MGGPRLALLDVSRDSFGHPRCFALMVTIQIETGRYFVAAIAVDAGETDENEWAADGRERREEIRHGALA